jgi:hypothetical protein
LTASGIASFAMDQHYAHSVGRLSTIKKWPVAGIS